LTPPAN